MVGDTGIEPVTPTVSRRTRRDLDDRAVPPCAALCRLSCWFVSSGANARWAQVGGALRKYSAHVGAEAHPLPLPNPAGQPRGGPSRRPAPPGEGALLCSWDGPLDCQALAAGTQAGTTLLSRW